MRIYTLAHRKESEVEGGEYEYEFVRQNIGIGQLVNQLRRMDFSLLYQYVIFEEEATTGEILDKQNADEWFSDYLGWARSSGFKLGDRVASIYKARPIYQIVKIHRTTVWLKPYDEDKGTAYGATQKSVPWEAFEKYRG